VTINRNKMIDREETIKMILTPTQQEYSTGENWLGHGKRGSGAAKIDYMLLEGSTMSELLKQRRAVYEHFSHLKNEHGLSVINEGGIHKFDRADLGISEIDGRNSSVNQITASSIFYLPIKADFESAYRTLVRPGEAVSIDAVLDQIEITATKECRSLKNDWRMITEANIETWSKKR